MTDDFQEYKTLELRRLLHALQAGFVEEEMKPVLEVLNQLHPVATMGCCKGHDEELAYLTFSVQTKHVWQELQYALEALMKEELRIKTIEFELDTWDTTWICHTVGVRLDTGVQGQESADIFMACARIVEKVVRGDE